MRRIEVPVLVVGAGPTGLTAGLLLRRLGIEHRLVERRAGAQRAPAAHCVNARTFEIFRQLGVDGAALAAASQDPADAGFVYYVDKLGGEVIGRLPYERQGDDVLDLTPTPLRNLSQHRLEPILVDALCQTGAAAPHYGHEWLSARQDESGVLSRLRDVESDEEYEVWSRALLAADGAGSRVRKWLGIAPVGPDRVQSFVMIHFAANLREVVRDCPGVMYWICDPQAGGILVAHDIEREWVYMHPWDPEREDRESYSAAVCEGLVRRACADDTVSLRVETVSTWTMTAQIAERYRDGRVFLVGDAAHRFPPTGGLGLNTGVQDAHNLIWKLAAVEAGWGGASLLDTYERERRPVAAENAEQSMRNALRVLEVPEALGVSDDPVASGARMREILASRDGRDRVAAAIANQAEHFDMIGLQLGFAYECGALVGDGAARPRAENPVRQMLPNSVPGSRLPHGWIRWGGARVSTLDLVPPDRFVLLVGEEGTAWQAAAARRDLRCLRVNRDFDDPGRWWTSVAGMEPGGALLVRPDQHIAFRSRVSVGDPSQALAAALARVTRGEAPDLARD